MKAFLMGMVALVVITAASALVLNGLPNSSAKSVYTDKANVRL